jgi:hypothetical protein
VSLSEANNHQSSFRDPAGFIFESGGIIYRQVNNAGAKDYDHFMRSGLYEELVKNGWLVPHSEITSTSKFSSDNNRYKIIKPQQLPFISYPYEWSFSQLRDAALLTLKVQKLALEHGMILKDSSSYNIQFIGRRPVFIDTLSFWLYEEGSPWEGYKQFCEHFLAPLAICAYNTPAILPTMRVFIDGLPLAVAVKLLPHKARYNRSLFAHIYLHASSQKRYDKLDTSAPKKQRKLSKLALDGLMSSLERSVKKLKRPNVKTQWGDYYNDTNYSKKAFSDKEKVVENMLKKVSTKPKMVWDLGANDGTFSNIAAGTGAYTIAFDMDSKAVEQGYLSKGHHDELILPLVQDLSNPSPGLGWAHMERSSLEQRGAADVALALAVIHHLSITNHAPFSKIASFMSKICKYLIIEFVPKGDSKVELLLSGFSRNKFEDYTAKNFETAFSKHFKLIDKSPVKDSKRVIYLYKVK